MAAVRPEGPSSRRGPVHPAFEIAALRARPLAARERPAAGSPDAPTPPLPVERPEPGAHLQGAGIPGLENGDARTGRVAGDGLESLVGD